MESTFASALEIGVYAEGVGAGSYSAYLLGSTFTSGSSLWLSDSTYKDNIQTLGVSVDTLFKNLNPVSFVFNQVAQDRLNTGNDQKVGFLAQQIEAIYPWMVKEVVLPAEYDTLGVEIHPEATYKAVDVTQLIPVIVSDAQRKNTEIKQLTIKNAAQDSVITDLNTRLTTLENCLSGILPFLCQLSNSSIQQNDEQTQQNIIKELKVKLNNIQSIVLGQNVPNPFAEQTVIEYYIPEAVKQAQIIFYNQTGQIINTLNIEEMGNGRLTVFANDLSSGIYTYTLVADGQVIATKKMVKTK